jgi:LemA protein
MTPASMAAAFAVGLLLAIVAFIVVASYNAVMALRQRIDKAWSNIDVALKQRHDQLPALVAAVRGAMAFEQEVLTEVTRARAAYSPTEPIPTQAVHAEATSAAVRSLFAVVEAYPAVKSQQNVLDLQDEIEPIDGSSTTTRSTATTRGSRRSRRCRSPGCSAGARANSSLPRPRKAFARRRRYERRDPGASGLAGPPR